MAKKDAGKNPEGWFAILGLCRDLGSHGQVFTAEDLNHRASFRRTEKSTSLQISSAWLGKFAGWGYLERGEADRSKVGLRGGRPPATYRMTDLGNTCSERPGRLTRLIAHISALQAARGRPEEGKLYHELFLLADEIKKNDGGER